MELDPFQYATWKDKGQVTLTKDSGYVNARVSIYDRYTGEVTGYEDFEIVAVQCEDEIAQLKARIEAISVLLSDVSTLG